MKKLKEQDTAAAFLGEMIHYKLYPSPLPGIEIEWNLFIQQVHDETVKKHLKKKLKAAWYRNHVTDGARKVYKQWYELLKEDGDTVSENSNGSNARNQLDELEQSPAIEPGQENLISQKTTSKNLKKRK